MRATICAIGGMDDSISGLVGEEEGDHLVPAEVHKLAGAACCWLADVRCWRHHLHHNFADHSVLQPYILCIASLLQSADGVESF